MRNVVYTRRMILKQTRRFIIQKGFRNVTARNLATYMEMSTQPIYKQFDSIQSLQKEVIEEYFQKLAADFISQGLSKDNALEQFALYFAAHSQKEYPWFCELFLTKKRDADVSASVRGCSYELFKSLSGMEHTLEPATLAQVHENYLALLIGATVWEKQRGKELTREEWHLLLQPQFSRLMQIKGTIEE